MTLDEIKAKPMLKVGDLCKLLDVSVPTLWRARKVGKIPPPDFLIGRAARWNTAKILKEFGFTE